MTGPRVLVVRVGAMGDVLHALPAVAGLRARWPAAEIDWVVDARWAPLLESAEGDRPVVSGVLPAATRLWSSAPVSRETAGSIRQLRRALRAGRHTCVVDLQGTLRSAVLGRLSGAGRRVGFRDPRERAARAFYTETRERRGEHVVRQYAALLGDALGVVLEPAVPVLPRSLAGERWATEWLGDGSGPVALLAPTAGWGAKEWPAARFGALAQRLTKRGWRVLLNAAHAGEAVPGAALAASEGAATIVTPGVGELLALTRRASLVVGGDTGPVHLAACLGVPTVALFGPTDPARNGPWGPGRVAVLRSAASRTSYRHVPEAEPGLLRLEVAEVLAAVEAVTEGGVRLCEDKVDGREGRAD